MSRRHERFETRDFPGRLPPKSRIEILNISVDGVAVETREPLKPDKTYTLELGQGSETLTLSGAVKWSRLQGTRRGEHGDIDPVYESGVSFGDQFASFPHHVLPLIERYAAIVPGEPLAGLLTTEGSLGIAFEVEKLGRSQLVARFHERLEEGLEGVGRIEMEGAELSLETRVARVDEDDEKPGFEVGLALVRSSPALEELVRNELAKRLWPSR